MQIQEKAEQLFNEDLSKRVKESAFYENALQAYGRYESNVLWYSPLLSGQRHEQKSLIDELSSVVPQETRDIFVTSYVLGAEGDLRCKESPAVRDMMDLVTNKAGIIAHENQTEESRQKFGRDHVTYWQYSAGAMSVWAIKEGELFSDKQPFRIAG